MIVSKCRQCDRQFTHARNSARYCTECRADINRERQRERNAQARAHQDEIRVIAESLREHLMPEHYARIEEYLAELGVPQHEAGIVHDQQPEGTMSHGGSDDGMSTTHEDLATELDTRRLAVITHDWFVEHPFWQDGLYG